MESEVGKESSSLPRPVDLLTYTGVLSLNVGRLYMDGRSRLVTFT